MTAPTLTATQYADLLAWQDQRDAIFIEQGHIARALYAIAHDGEYYPGEADQLATFYDQLRAEYDALDARIQDALLRRD